MPKAMHSKAASHTSLKSSSWHSHWGPVQCFRDFQPGTLSRMGTQTSSQGGDVEARLTGDVSGKSNIVVPHSVTAGDGSAGLPCRCLTCDTRWRRRAAGLSPEWAAAWKTRPSCSRLGETFTSVISTVPASHLEAAKPLSATLPLLTAKEPTYYMHTHPVACMIRAE